MIVDNVSVLSKDDAYNCLYKSAKTNLLKKYIYTILGFVFGIGMLIYGLILLDSQWISMGGIILVLGLAYGVFNTVMIIKAPNDIQKKNKEVCTNGITYTFKFREHSVDLVCSTTAKKNKLNFNYKEFKRVYEYEDRFEIKLANTEVLYVLKSGFQNERMIQFFKKNLGTNKKLKITNKIKKD